MKKLNKLGIGILLGCFLVNSITEEDFNLFKSKLLKHAKNVEPKLVDYFYDLSNLVRKENNELTNEAHNEKIILKLKDIKDELESIKSEELANLIINELDNENEDQDE